MTLVFSCKQLKRIKMHNRSLVEKEKKTKKRSLQSKEQVFRCSCDARKKRFTNKLKNTHYFRFISDYTHINCRLLLFCSSLYTPFIRPRALFMLHSIHAFHSPEPITQNERLLEARLENIMEFTVLVFQGRKQNKLIFRHIYYKNTRSL